MKPPLHRNQRFNGFAILLCALLFPLAACAQFSPAETGSAHSTSGQFIVTGGREISPLARSPAIATNTGLVRLEPALLAVSAERLKEALRRQLGIGQSAAWSGKIFLVLHPAQSSDEGVTIISTRFVKTWNYRVELPDIVSRTRLARALTGVLLLEFANRNASVHPAEIPAWLTDGMSQQITAAGSPENLLSLPDKIVNGMSLTQIDETRRGIDPLADARQALKNFPALTFEQLGWPDDAQVSGGDGGAYRASAQLFVSEILKLKNGPAHLRAMLQNLPRFYNWQTSFQNAFRENFPAPLDVEKWWALEVVDFAARDPGPQWPPAVSRARLDDILSVPVEMRTASNSLPSHAEISLQAVIRNFNPAQQTTVLRTKLRDLELARFRLVAPLAVLAGDYRRVIGDYLDAGIFSRARPANPAADTLKKLDALDAQRRTIEENLKTGDFTLPVLNATAP